MIKQQLNAFSRWLGCNVFEYTIKAQINDKDVSDDPTERDKYKALQQAFAKTTLLFDMVKENIEDIMNGGDDDENT